MVQFLKTNVDPQKVETPIVICLRTTRRWLCKLGYEYKDVCKNVFVDGHEQSDIVKDHKNFLKKMEELKFYMVTFEKNGIMKPKIYPPDCAVRRYNHRPIIVFTHDEYTFFANNGI